MNEAADLLRYLHKRRRLPEVAGDIPLAFVTVGSPLRDLYAEHFRLQRGGLRDRTAECVDDRRGRMG